MITALVQPVAAQPPTPPTTPPGAQPKTAPQPGVPKPTAPPTTTPPAKQPTLPGTLPKQPTISEEPPDEDELAQADLPTTPPQFGFLLLNSVPNMIGDFYGGSGATALVGIPAPVSQPLSLDVMVTNLNGGGGADPNPAVPIVISQGAFGQISMSNGVGVDTNGDGVADSYPIFEPTGTNPPSPPTTPVPGTSTFTNGTVNYTGTGSPVGDASGWTVNSNYAFVPNFVDNGPIQIMLPPAGGAVVRRVKIAENLSPQPRNRVFFTYNFFRDVIGGLGDVNRYTFGVESTYWDGTGSLELRVPFAGTLAATQSLEAYGAHGTEFGNISLNWKHLLWESDRSLISAGVGLAVPSAADTIVKFGPTEILRIENEAYHVLPYVAAMSAPTERWFWQGFVQWDLDLNGNTAKGDVSGLNVRRFGVVNDAALMFVDFGAGYRIYQNPCACLRNITAIAELHYATTLQDADVVEGNGFRIEGFTNRFDVIDLTLGGAFRFGERTVIRPGVVIPLKDGDDKHFDYEATVQMNVFF